MKSLNQILPLCLFLPALLIGATSLNVLAEQPQRNERKAQLKDCVQELSLQPSQMEALLGMQQQTNLTPEQKRNSIFQILTPQQKEQLRECME
jgi:hypothetical protein